MGRRQGRRRFPRGAYHFVYWCRQPHEEIGNFESIVPVEADALPPVLDVEATPTSRTCKRTLYREEVLADMRKMLEEMERHYGKKPIIYTSVDFYQSILHSNALAEYPIWVRSTKYHPAVRYGDRKWTFWQYRSDGSVPGIPALSIRTPFTARRSSGKPGEGADAERARQSRLATPPNMLYARSMSFRCFCPWG